MRFKHRNGPAWRFSWGSLLDDPRLQYTVHWCEHFNRSSYYRTVSDECHYRAFRLAEKQASPH